MNDWPAFSNKFVTRFSRLPILKLKGEVFSGTGEARAFTELPWAKTQMKIGLGFTPYSGTLNLRLFGRSVRLRHMLGDIGGKELIPPQGCCRGLLFKAKLRGAVECAIVIPKVQNYPADVLEVVAPVSLRNSLDLRDGDTVQLEVIL